MKNHSTCSSFYGLYRLPPESCAAFALGFFANLPFFVSTCIYSTSMCICAYTVCIYTCTVILLLTQELNRFAVLFHILAWLMKHFYFNIKQIFKLLKRTLCHFFSEVTTPNLLIKTNAGTLHSEWHIWWRNCSRTLLREKRKLLEKYNFHQAISCQKWSANCTYVMKKKSSKNNDFLYLVDGVGNVVLLCDFLCLLNG